MISIKSKSLLIIFISALLGSCATNKSPYKNDSDTHFYSSDLQTTVKQVEEAVIQSGMDIVSTSSESANSVRMNIVLNAYGVSESDKVQLYNASVNIEKLNEKVIRVEVNDRRKRPATVASTDVKDYGSDLLQKIDKKLPAYKAVDKSLE